MKSIHKMRKKIIVIVGPNASGKSNLGVFLAKKLQSEIISADSRQVYKKLNVGSGKITKKEMGGVTHHCLDIVNPKKTFTAYDYKKCAREAIQKIWRENKTPIIVGGTGFYIDATLGRVKLSNVPPNLKLRKWLTTKSVDQLFLMLKKLNLGRAKNIDKNNKVRLIRAIEIMLENQRTLFTYSRPASAGLRGFRAFLPLVPPMRDFVDHAKKAEKSVQRVIGFPIKNILWIGIKRSPEDLKKRIHNRLLRRLQGIIKEIESLRKNGLTWKRLFDLGLEYRYVSLYLRGKLSKENMLKKLETEINKYAKRQMTYFKRNKNIHWVKSKKEVKKLSQHFLLA